MHMSASCSISEFRLSVNSVHGFLFVLPSEFRVQTTFFLLGFSIQNVYEAVFTSHANPKYFLFHPSYRIFGRMHGVLNVGKKDN
jgi:hypothetical protein